MHYIGIIPSRYASTRFPGKPLIYINGKTMIQRVYEQATASNLEKVYVATDDQKIFDHVLGFGGLAVMTSNNHQSGTDRCSEVAVAINLADDDVVINIQGDEPFIDPLQINLLCNCFIEKENKIGTLIKKIEQVEHLIDVNLPKVVINAKGKAIYFSRSMIPHLAKIPQTDWLHNFTFYRHIGIYGYRVKTLLQISKLPISLLEKAESLEQLRWIENGFEIATAITKLETISIDTPDDLKKIPNTQ